MTADLVARTPSRGVRFRVLLPVNLLLGAGMAALLVLDYRSDLADQVGAMHVALSEEAKTLLPAALYLREKAPRALQGHIDDVCGRMQDTSSPGHHIVVETGGEVWQAHAHHRDSPSLLEAVRAAAASADHTAPFAGDAVLVGVAQEGNGRVLVSERLSMVRAKTRGRALWRGAVLAGLGLLGALLVNVILLRVVVRPIHRLVDGVRSLGRGAFDTRIALLPTTEFQFLASEIHAMAASLAQVEDERKRDMARARAIQRHLNSAVGDLLSLRVEILHRPAEEVGGDYYEVRRLADGTGLLCVADVMGHGVPAALEAAVLKALIATAAERADDPAEILRLVNERFRAVTPAGDFATVFLARLDGEKGLLRYASAGHEPAFLLAADGTSMDLPATGMVLGVQDGTVWSGRDVQAGPGTRMFVVTDGVTESRAPDGTRFERTRLEDRVVSAAGGSLSSALEAIWADVDVHRSGTRQEDDVTLAGVEFLEPQRV